MICWDTAHGRFNYRVAGVCIERGCVLLCQFSGTDDWFLPGGRCELMEPAAEALAREMREELGVGVRVGRLLWIAENFFALDGRRFHEIGLYFRLFLPPGTVYRDRNGVFVRAEGTGELTFRWFPLDALPEERLVPPFLRTGLRRLPHVPQHVVEDEIEPGRAPSPRPGST